MTIDTDEREAILRTCGVDELTDEMAAFVRRVRRNGATWRRVLALCAEEWGAPSLRTAYPEWGQRLCEMAGIRFTTVEQAQVEDEIMYRGARAYVYKATDDHIWVELLEDTPVSEGTSPFAAMVLRNSQDGSEGGSEGDLFQIPR